MSIDPPVGLYLDHLRPDGKYYVVIGFSIPYCLYLPDGIYKVLVQAAGYALTGQVELKRGQRRLSEAGSLSRVLATANDTQKFADRRGVFCYSSILVYIPVMETSLDTLINIEKAWEVIEKNRFWYHELAIIAFNRLVEIYRFCTGECHIKLLTGRDLWFDFNFFLLLNQRPPQAITLPLYHTSNVLPATVKIPEFVFTDIREKLIADFYLPLSEELLLNVHDLIDQGNYRLAVIEVEAAYEAALYELLRSHFGDKLKVKNYSDPGNLIEDKPFQAIMQSKHKQFDLTDHRYKRWKKHVWNVRNGLVHGRRSSVTYEAAVDAVQIVENILEYVKDRPPTRPWRFS